MSEVELAERVADTASALNEAMDAASIAGLRVEADVHMLQYCTRGYPTPSLEVSVARPLSRTRPGGDA